MASVTKEFLINSMIVDPRTDREIGFNSALITILKELIRDVDSTVLDPAYNIFMKVLSKHYSDYRNLKPFEVNEVITFIKTNQKLQAVKRLKEITQLGLKEAKDAIDEYTG
jgi:ribosomal protein L7/L12